MREALSVIILAPFIGLLALMIAAAEAWKQRGR